MEGLFAATQAVTQDPSTIEALADWATVVVGAAAVVSIWIGLISLREVRRERIQRVRPWLAFDHGGQMVSCEEAQTSGLPGLNPAFIHKLIGDRKRAVRKPTSQWGKLRNHGGGVALNTSVTFVPVQATVGNETFRIEPDKLNEFPYDLRLNKIPASPTHIHTGEEAMFFRLPAPIFEREGNRKVLTGVAVIACRDVLNRRHVRYQHFRAGVQSIKAEKVEDKDFDGVLITFGDEYTPVEAREELGALAGEVEGLDESSRARAHDMLVRIWVPGVEATVGRALGVRQ